MKRVSIKPHWTIRFPNDKTLPPRLLGLLAEVNDAGSLSAACNRTGVSYRHAWDLIRQGEQLFGAGLVAMERGRGSRLTDLGRKLVWADQRIEARLGPGLETLASELEAEIESVLKSAPVVLRIHATHGFAIETLCSMLSNVGITFDRKYCSSLEAPAALRDGSCDLAGFHIPFGAQEPRALAHYARWFDPSRHFIIDMVTRRQGLIVAPGNPRKIYELADLVRPDVRFINRQSNSGTRFLLEGLLDAQGIDGDDINGFEQGEFTHAAVAAYVASDMADVGFGLEVPARRFKLDFIPITSERYFLMCDAAALELGAMGTVLEILRSVEFGTTVNSLAGYETHFAGRVLPLGEAFPALATPAAV